MHTEPGPVSQCLLCEPGGQSMLVDTDDVRSLTARLSRLLADRELRQSLHRRQQRLVSAYDVAAVADRFLDMYERAIAQRRGDASARAE